MLFEPLLFSEVTGEDIFSHGFLIRVGFFWCFFCNTFMQALEPPYPTTSPFYVWQLITDFVSVTLRKSKVLVIYI